MAWASGRPGIWLWIGKDGGSSLRAFAAQMDKKKCVFCAANRCIPAPVVDNAAAVMLPAQRTVQLTCLPGHRFSNGHRTKNVTCSALDGSWPMVESCEG